MKKNEIEVGQEYAACMSRDSRAAYSTYENSRVKVVEVDVTGKFGKWHKTTMHHLVKVVRWNNHTKSFDERNPVFYRMSDIRMVWTEWMKGYEMEQENDRKRREAREAHSEAHEAKQEAVKKLLPAGVTLEWYANSDWRFKLEGSPEVMIALLEDYAKMSKFYAEYSGMVEEAEAMADADEADVALNDN